jgi:hypothetical protein
MKVQGEGGNHGEAHRAKNTGGGDSEVSADAVADGKLRRFVAAAHGCSNERDWSGKTAGGRR